MMLMRLAYQRKVKELRNWANQLASRGREPQKQFLAYCQHLLRENFMYNFRRAELVRLTPSEEAFSKNFARFINEKNIIPLTEELARAEADIAQNANARIVFFDLALTTITLLIR